MGSSETIRRSFSVKNLFMKNICFCTYLTGYIEGNGTFILPNQRVSKKNKKNYPSVEICFHYKNLPLFLIIQRTLNCGSLNRKKGDNAYTYTINSQEKVIFLVSLVNGYMRTPKIYDLWKVIDWFNTENLSPVPPKEKEKGGKIVKREKDESSLLSNGWLSGFIEADGHFYVRTNPIQFKIECKFEIVQPIIDHNNRSSKCFLEKISNTLYSSVKMIRQTKPKKEYRVRTTNLKGNTVLEEYFKEYPLFGSKFLDFQDWLILLLFFKKKVHKNQIFYDQMVSIKSRMNQNRKDFSWNHLNNFYHLEK